MECQWRYVYACMCFLGLVLVYMMRVNLNVALVAMVNNTAVDNPNKSVECAAEYGNYTNEVKYGEFNWSPAQQTMILASFYWGYTLLQIPCGILSLYFSAKWMYGISTLLTALFTFFVPLAADYGPYHLVVLRFFIGLVEGPTYPTQYTLSGRWVLDTESAMILTFISSGSTIGTIVGQSITGLICQYIGWRWVFYIMGMIGVVWFILYIFLVHNKPSCHPFISLKEKNMLIDRVPHNRVDYEPKKVKVPWKRILTSRSYWAFLINSGTYNFTWYTMINCLPIYIGVVLGFNISKNGGLSSLPYIAMLISSLFAAFLQDWINSKKVISLTKIRKIFSCLGMVLSAIFLFCIIYTGCDVTLTILFLCISVAMLGVTVSTLSVNLIDLSPSYSGAILSIVNVVNSLFGIITPYVKSYFTRNGETRENWSNIFLTGSCLSIIGATTYMLFGSGSMQPWNDSYNKMEEVFDDNEDVSLISNNVVINSTVRIN